MKNNTIFCVLICTVILMNISCSKSEDNNQNGTINPEKTKLRISMMANNIGMSNAFIFTYNTDGLLSRRSNDWLSYDEITYNTNKQPIKIQLYQYINSKPYNIGTTNIEWISGGIIFTEAAGGRNIYKLSTQNKITSCFVVYEDMNGIPDTAHRIKYIWYGDDSLKIEQREQLFGEVSYGVLGYNEYLYASHFKFGKQKSPFYGINTALSFWYTDFLCSAPSDFCITEYKDFTAKDGIILVGTKANISYTFNDQNYPLTAEIKYLNLVSTNPVPNLPNIEYKYFKYDSY